VQRPLLLKYSPLKTILSYRGKLNLEGGKLLTTIPTTLEWKFHTF
jgi:hypothetical protein